MALLQSIACARAERIGDHGIPAAVFDEVLQRSGTALEWLRARHADASLPLLRLPEKRDDLALIREIARRLSAGASNIVLLGTCGSSLGGQTLAGRAESLGKDGKGTTPVAALGPVDQHSQLQLFIAGPRDKLITVVTAGADGHGSPMPIDLSALAGEPEFADKTIADLAAAEGRATAETLARHGCRVCTIHLECIDEANLGELLMHFMLETIIAARLLGVDPFDQPAVEEGKLLAKRYLRGETMIARSGRDAHNTNA